MVVCIGVKCLCIYCFCGLDVVNFVDVVEVNCYICFVVIVLGRCWYVFEIGIGVGGVIVFWCDVGI